jgi:hypothetical protein
MNERHTMRYGAVSGWIIFGFFPFLLIGWVWWLMCVAEAFIRRALGRRI